MDEKKIIDKIKKVERYINGWERMKRSAVIIPIVKINDELHLLFEVRAKKLNSQPGDICFPGGKIDGSESPKEAALREICEELNVKDIGIVNELDTVVRYDGLIIHPFVGIIDDVKQININENEVDHVFYIPIDYLINHKYMEVDSKITIERSQDFPYDLIVNKENYKFREATYRSIFYKYEEYTIWGITAEMLHNFLNKIS